jgi:glucosamine-6-phosphate deaminase
MGSSHIKPTIFYADEELGVAAARVIFSGIQSNYSSKEKYVLGCPGGRSPRSTYRALAKLVSTAQQSLRHVFIAMMDEYVWQSPDGQFTNVDENSHFSCRKFAFHEIRDLLNQGLAPEFQLPYEQVLVPDAQKPTEYEDLLRNLGVDCFLLASGATDGHVAFNGRGTDRNATTRITSLSEETRTDNRQTFPNFTSLADVPKFGVTIGPETIASVSKKTIMLLQGEHKAMAFDRIAAASRYDSDWPATIIVECQDPQIFVDSKAAKA